MLVVRGLDLACSRVLNTFGPDLSCRRLLSTSMGDSECLKYLGLTGADVGVQQAGLEAGEASDLDTATTALSH